MPFEASQRNVSQLPCECSGMRRTRHTKQAKMTPLPRRYVPSRTCTCVLAGRGARRAAA